MGLCPTKSATNIQDVTKSKLHVILPISNPMNFKVREQRFQECLQKLLKVANINIIVVRLIYEGHSLLSVNRSKPYTELLISTTRENILWSKENLINIGVDYIKQHFTNNEVNESNQDRFYSEIFIAWIDADIDFMNRSWVTDTIRELRALEMNGNGSGGFVQLFSQANFLGPKNEIIKTLNSFCYQRALGKTYREVSNDHSDYWHPGFAWAATLHTLMKINGGSGVENGSSYLIEKTIGGADRHMAMSFLGLANQTVPDNVSQQYRYYILNWQHIISSFDMKTSYVRGIINHYWHGDLINRKYLERWQILVKNNFIPDDFMYRGLSTGDRLLIYRNSNTQLQKDIYQYFLERNEDSNVVIGGKGNNNRGGNNGSRFNNNYNDSSNFYNSNDSNDSQSGGGNSHHHYHHHHHDDSNNYHHGGGTYDGGNSGWSGYG